MQLLLLAWRGLSPSVLVQGELGKGSFQELDQVKAVKQFTKYAGQAKSVKDILRVITDAAKASFLPSLCSPVQLAGAGGAI